VLAAASEAFTRRNIKCSIAESLERFHPIKPGTSRGIGAGIAERIAE
jgi:hypothetical protein